MCFESTITSEIETNEPFINGFAQVLIINEGEKLSMAPRSPLNLSSIFNKIGDHYDLGHTRAIQESSNLCS